MGWIKSQQQKNELMETQNAWLVFCSAVCGCKGKQVLLPFMRYNRYIQVFCFYTFHSFIGEGISALPLLSSNEEEYLGAALTQ